VAAAKKKKPVNPFDDHELTYISPSSVSAYLTDRSYWIAKYIFKIESNAGPAAWRGTAVEAGLEASFFAPSKSPLAVAYQSFEGEAQGELRDDIEAERRAIPAMLEQAQKAFSRHPQKPIITQQKHLHDVPGLMVPLMGYSDFTYEDHHMDLKTTMRCPSKPKPNHAMQVSFYAKASGHDKAYLCYVTPKRNEIYRLDKDEIEENYNEIVRHAKAIQSMLLTARIASEVLDDRDAKTILAEQNTGDFSSFYWDDETRQTALAHIEAWK